MGQIYLLYYAKGLMITCGIWGQPIFKNYTIEKLYNIYEYISQFFYVTICFLMVIEFFYLLGGKDVNKITDNIKITVTCSEAAIKFIMFKFGYVQKLICQIINEEQTLIGLKDREVKNIYFGFVKYVNNFAKVILALAFLTGIFLIISTDIRGLIMTSKDNATSKPMMFLAYFPFDQEQYYGISLLIQSFSMAIAGFYYCMSQIIYISILMFAKAQLKVLQLYFKKFDQYALLKLQLQEIEMVKMLIKKHQFIISFVKELNESLKYLLLIEFLLSSLSIASVVSQIIAGQTIIDLSFNIIYISVLIGQLFVLAWHANEIKIESIAISDAIYESPWHEKSLEIRKTLMLAMLRSQKPLTLTLGPFNPVTTQTVISVINAAYSYVTIMTRHN